MQSLVYLMLALCLPAHAGDDDDALFNDKASKPSDEVDKNKFSTEDDDLGVPTFTPKVEPVAPQKMLDVTGKPVLGDNWAPTVVVADQDAVVVELPVLYARNRAEFDGVSYWLLAEAWSNGQKVAEARAMVTREGVAEKGPSVQFFRMFVPVTTPSGTVELKVSKLGNLPTSGPEPLFSRLLSYKL